MVGGVYDILIVGGGVIGASIFHRVSSRGFRACLLERNKVCQECTSYSGAVIRCYHHSDILTDRALRGLKYYKEFEHYTGTKLDFITTGFLFIDSNEILEIAQRRVDELSEEIDIAVVSAEQVSALFPGISMNQGEFAIFEPNSGYMDPYRVTTAWIKCAEERGGQLIEGAEVLGLIQNHIGDGYQGVNTNIGKFYGNKIVICAGASSVGILDREGCRHNLYPQAIQVNRFKIRPGAYNYPAYIDEVNRLNGRPEVDGDVLFVGYPTEDRNFLDQRVNADANHIKLVAKEAERRLKDVSIDHSVGGLRAFDSYTEDRLGEIRYLDSAETTIIASGLSGGGFKQAPAVAEDIEQLL